MSFVNKTIREATALTGSYVACDVLDDVYSYNQLELLIDWSKALLTSLQIKLEFSVDGTNFFRETTTSVFNGTTEIFLNEYTISDTGKFIISIPVSYRFVKVSVKGSGVVLGAECKVVALLHKS